MFEKLEGLFRELHLILLLLVSHVSHFLEKTCVSLKLGVFVILYVIYLILMPLLFLIIVFSFFLDVIQIILIIA